MKKLLIPIIIILLALINHSKPFLYPETNDVSVSASGEIFGHKSITIDENDSTTVAGSLNFNLLGEWQYEVDSSISCPQNIMELSGKRVVITGFMYPLDLGSEIYNFCLLKTTQTCCYGPKPEYNQYLFVESKCPVTFERFSPVSITGTFYVDQNPDEGYIYRFEADKVVAAERKTKDVDIYNLSEETGIPIFDFSIMKSGSYEKLDGKQFIVDGYVTGVDGDDLYLSENYWDGVSNGVMPNLYNTIVVQPINKSNLPMVWEPKATFIGELRAYNGENKHETGSLIVLGKGEIQGRCKTSLLNRGFIPIYFELTIILLLILFYLIKILKNRRKTVVPLLILLSVSLTKADDKIMAEINGVNIYESQLKKGLEKGSYFKRQEESILSSRLTILINDLIVDQELSKLGLAIPKEVIDKEIKEYRETPPSMDVCCAYPSLEEYYEINSINEDLFRKQLRTTFGVDSILSTTWENENFLTDEEIESTKKDYRKVWHIFFNVFQDPDYMTKKDEVIAKKRKIANEVAGLLETGKISFEDAVKSYSEDNLSVKKGGYLGPTFKSSFGNRMRETMLNLEKGSLSSAVESFYGFHIIKVEKVTDLDAVGIIKDRYIAKHRDKLLGSLTKESQIVKF